MILELAKASGAYVIVSSTDSTSDSALKSRRSAMVEALQGIPDAANITLEFYDRNRIATWARDHVGLIPWVRSRIGKSIPGWRSHGPWSHAPEERTRPISWTTRRVSRPVARTKKTVSLRYKA